MVKALKRFLLCVAILTMPTLSITGNIPQVHKRVICGKVISRAPGTDIRTVVVVSFGLDGLSPGAVTEKDGSFCIESFVSDLSESTPARLYVTSFCSLNDVTLVDVPFWPPLRKRKMFAGKSIAVGPGNRTNVGEVNEQITYGHVSLRIVDSSNRPLLTHQEDWTPLWLKIRDQNGVTVHESGLSIRQIERAVDLKESSINLALPKGIWTLELALAGRPPDTGKTRRAVKWLRVPGKLRIDSCTSPVGAAVSVSGTRKS